MTRTSTGVLAALGFMLLASSALAADVTLERLRNPEPQNWLMNHGDYNAHHYSALERINKTLTIIPIEIKKRSGLPLRPVEALVVEPSQRLDHLAAEHVHSLPWPVRLLLRGIGGTSQRGSALASYLLFERSYTRALMDLGHRDAMARREELQRFLRLG